MAAGLIAVAERGLSLSSFLFCASATVRRFFFHPEGRQEERMIGPYGDTDCSARSASQARQPQLGASHAACTCARH